MLSSLTRQMYNEKDSVRIVNMKQSAFYWSKGIKPLDIYPSLDYKYGEPIIVFIFSKSETAEVYKEWVARRNQQ